MPDIRTGEPYCRESLGSTPYASLFGMIQWTHVCSKTYEAFPPAVGQVTDKSHNNTFATCTNEVCRRSLIWRLFPLDHCACNSYMNLRLLCICVCHSILCMDMSVYGPGFRLTRMHLWIYQMIPKFRRFVRCNFCGCIDEMMTCTPYDNQGPCRSLQRLEIEANFL